MTHKAVLTPRQLHTVLVEAFTDHTQRPVVVPLSILYDVTTWYSGCVNPHLKHYSRPHVFRFKKNEAGVVVTSYKMWSASEYYPRQREAGATSTVPRQLAALHEGTGFHANAYGWLFNKFFCLFGS